MTDDFDEDSLRSYEPCDSIKSLRNNKRETYYFTVKQWNKFNRLVDNDLTAQEVLLSKYNIILTDYKVNPLLNYKDLNKKELTVKILKNFNMSNFNKGMKIFNQGVKGFTDSIDAVTSQLGDGSKNKDFILPKKKTNSIKIWSEKKQSSKKNNLKIWSDDIKKTKKKTRKRKSVQSRSNTWDNHERNMEKIWGKKK